CGAHCDARGALHGGSDDTARARPFTARGHSRRRGAAARSRGAAVSRTEMYATVHAAVRTLRGADDVAATFFVPGRIEVLGKHTDYAGGRSLLAAVNRG